MLSCPQGTARTAWLRQAHARGDDHHRERAQFRRDVARANALRDAGWLVLRFTADDVLRNPNGAITHVAKAIRERR